MTREEAISVLKQVNHILVNDDDYWIENTHEPLNTAFDMAIKALEKEPCEDCISRRELNNKIEMLDMRYGSDFYWETKGIIDKLPSVYSKQKIGHWIDKDVRGSIEPYCSVCGDSVDTTYHYSYCPNCGTKMIEQQGSEE